MKTIKHETLEINLYALFLINDYLDIDFTY